MKTKHILIIVAIIIVLYIWTKKSSEHLQGVSAPILSNEVVPTLSNEAIQSLSSVYSNTAGTASFNNLNVTNNLNPKSWKGMIVMWSGTADKIPTGWALCDGTNNTPDLRGKFIVGVGQGKTTTGVNLTDRKLGDQGGEEAVALTIKEMPSHDHDLEIWGDPNGEPDTPNKTTLKLTDRQYHHYKSWDNRGSRDDNNDNWPVQIIHKGGDNSITSVPGFNYDKPSTWGTKPHNNMPPFYALAYIIKV